MKWMNIAFKNFKNNFNLYGVHFFTMAVMVAIYYNFVSLKVNPGIIAVQKMRAHLESSGYLTAIIVGFFLVFFIWYSGLYFLNQRKKELGLFTLMGISQDDVARIYIYEYLILTVSAIVVGQAIGVIFGKFFFMILASLSIHDLKIPFFISWRGILETTVTFFLLTFFMTLKDYVKIKRSALIHLIKGKEKEEQLPTARFLTGVGGVLLIGMGYFCSYLSINNAFNILSLITVFLTCSGTFLFFKATISMILNVLSKWESFYYKGSNSFLIGQLRHRIRQNYRIFAIITILVASTITLFSTSLSMLYAVNQEDKYNYPYTLTYGADETETVAAMDKDLEELAIYPGARVELAYTVLEDVDMGYFIGDLTLVRKSDFIEIQKTLGISESKYKKISSMTDDEAYMVLRVNEDVAITVLPLDMVEEALGHNITIKEQLHAPLLGVINKNNSLIVSDEMYVTLKGDNPETLFVGVRTDDEKAVLYDELLNKYMEGKEKGTIPFITRLFLERENTNYRLSGLIFFICSFIAIVFLIATGSILYFKVLTDAFTDQEALETLMKIGLSNKGLKKVIRKQVGLYFFSPFVLALLHSAFAINTLEGLMGISLIYPLAVGTGVFLVMYILYYFLAVRKYEKFIHICG